MKRLAVLLILTTAIGCHRPVEVPKVSLADLRKEVDPSVRFAPVAIPDKDNGWPIFLKALSYRDNVRNGTVAPIPISLGQLYDELTKDKLNLDHIDQAEACLQPYKGKIELLKQAVSKPSWSAWQPNAMPNQTSPPFQFGAVLEINKALVIQTWASFQKGDRNAVRDGLLLHFRFGKRLIQAHEGMLGTLDGLLVLATASGNARRLADKNALTVADLKALLAEISQSDLSDDFLETLKVEFDRQIVLKIANLTFPTRCPTEIDGSGTTIEEALLRNCKNPLDRRETVREASKYLGALLLDLKKATGVKAKLPPLPSTTAGGWPQDVIGSGWPVTGQYMTKPLILDKQETSRSSQKLSKQANPVGKLILAWQMPQYLTYARRLVDLRSVQRFSQIRLASDIYKLEQTTQAISIGDLVAKGYLKETPINPRTGKPIQLSEVK